MFTPDFGWGHQLASVFGLVIWVVFCLLAFSVIVALIFLLVRFLLIGTRAAQLYVARHEPPRVMPEPAPPAAPTGGSDASRRPEGATAVRPEDLAETDVTETTATGPTDTTDTTDTTEGYAATRPLPTEALPAEAQQPTLGGHHAGRIRAGRRSPRPSSCRGRESHVQPAPHAPQDAAHRPHRVGPLRYPYPGGV